MEGNRQKDLDCSDLCILVCSYFSKICFGPGFTGQLCQSILSGFVAKIHLMSSSQSWKTLAVCLRGKLMMSEFLQASTRCLAGLASEFMFGLGTLAAKDVCVLSSCRW